MLVVDYLVSLRCLVFAMAWDMNEIVKIMNHLKIDVRYTINCQLIVNDLSIMAREASAALSPDWG